MGLWAVLAIWVIGIPVGAFALISLCQWRGSRRATLWASASGGPSGAPVACGPADLKPSRPCESKARSGARSTGALALAGSLSAAAPTSSRSRGAQ